MFSLISSSLSSAVTRFLTFELGKNDTKELAKIFSTSLLIHIALALAIILLTETLGIWFLNNQMTIPPDRLYAAKWVFHTSVISFVFGLICVPFNADIVAHEHMGTFAYIGIIESILKLIIVLFIAYTSRSIDRLIVYSTLLVLVSIILQCIYIIYCKKNFNECHLSLHIEKKYWKEMSSFAGWVFIGTSATVLKDNGVNLLYNLFFGPIMNTARGISSTVNNIISSFSNNFMAALRPQITKSYAAHDNEYTFNLINKGCRFSFYIMMLFCIPLILESNFVLSIWLTEFPAHTVNFVRLTLILSMIDCISQPLITLQTATGKIKKYQIIVGGTLFLNFPLSYLFLKIGFSPEVTYFIAITIAIICLILRIYLLKGMTGLNIKRFLIKVCGNIFIVFILSFLIPSIIQYIQNPGWTRFIITCTCSLITTCIVTYTIGCSSSERAFIKEQLYTRFKRK